MQGRSKGDEGSSKGWGPTHDDSNNVLSDVQGNPFANYSKVKPFLRFACRSHRKGTSASLATTFKTATSAKTPPKKKRYPHLFLSLVPPTRSPFLLHACTFYTL